MAMDGNSIAGLIVLLTVVGSFLICFCCNVCRGSRRGSQHLRRPVAQSVPLQPVPSRPVRAQDLETGLHHTSKVLDIRLFNGVYTPHFADNIYH